MFPKVSVIIPAHNEENTIQYVLDAVQKQEYPPDLLETIVIDDFSLDKTQDIVKKFSVKYIRNGKRFGLAKSLNVGIENSNGDIVVTLHSDCIPLSNDWIKKLVKHFNDPKVGVVTSYLLIKPKEMPIINRCFCHIYIAGWLWNNNKDNLTKPFVQVEYAGNKCDAYRRDLLKKLGGFDPIFRVSNEDIDICEKIKRLGYKIILDYEAKVLHALSSHQKNLKSHLKKAIEYSSPQLIILSRYKFCMGIDSIISLILALYAIPAFLTVINRWSTTIVLTLELLTIFLIFAFFYKKQPKPFYSEMGFKKRIIPWSGNFTIAVMLTCLFSIVLFSSLPIVFFPVFLALVMLAGPALVRGISYYRIHNEIKGGILTMLFSFIYNILYGLGFFIGAFKYIAKSSLPNLRDNDHSMRL